MLEQMYNIHTHTTHTRTYTKIAPKARTTAPPDGESYAALEEHYELLLNDKKFLASLPDNAVCVSARNTTVRCRNRQFLPSRPLTMSPPNRFPPASPILRDTRRCLITK